MAHELSIHNGRAEMAYRGETPWHGLGQQVDANASVADMAAAAHMQWDVLTAPVMFPVGGIMHPMDDRVVLHRSDNFAPLGVVSNNYRPVAPIEIVDFFQNLTREAGFELETLGALFGGKRLWGLATIGAEASIADPRDKMKGYLLLSTALDGSMSTEARYTTVRVVCNNTLGFARNRDKASVKVSHRTTFDATSVKRELGIDAARTQFDDAMAQFRRLSETRVEPVRIIQATAELFAPGFADKSRDDQAKLLEKTNGPIHRVGEMTLDRTAIGSELDGTNGTAWGWLNAVTQYVDHEARARSRDTRLNSAWYGRGAEVKQRALEMAVEMIGANGTTHTVYLPAPAVATPSDVDDHAAAGASMFDDVLAGTPALV